MISERVSQTLEQFVMFLSFQIVLSLVSAAVVCAILARTSGLDPYVADDCSRVFEALVCFGLLSIDFDFCADAVVCHQFGLFRTDLHAKCR